MSTICMGTYFLIHYFTKYEFTFIRDRILGKKFLKKQLQRFDCNEPAQLKEMIEWLLTEGSRQEFQTMYNQLTLFQKHSESYYFQDNQTMKNVRCELLIAHVT